jgi:hypothetical protein
MLDSMGVEPIINNNGEKSPLFSFTDGIDATD